MTVLLGPFQIGRNDGASAFIHMKWEQLAATSVHHTGGT